MANQKPIENELRELRFYPFPIYDRDNGTNLNSGDENLRLSVGHAGSFSFEVDLSQSYQVNEGRPLKVVVIGFDGSVFTIRCELDQPDPEFSKRFSVGDRVAIDHKDNWFNYDGECLFVDDQALELYANQGVSGGGSLTNANFEGGVKFRNYERFVSFDLKYNFCPLSLTDYSNGFDGGTQVLRGDSNATTVNLDPKTGSVRNWYLSKNDYNPTLLRLSGKQDYNVSYNNRTIVYPYQFRGVPFAVPFWSESLAQNYLDGTAPDDLVGDGTLKLVAELTCWRNEERTHDPVVFQFEKEGSFGWYNESGNGDESSFDVGSVSYFNLTKSVITESLDSIDQTTVSLNLDRRFGVFESSNKISVYLFRKTPFDEYNQSSNDLGLTYLYSATEQEIGSGSFDKIGKKEITSFGRNLTNGGQTLELSFTHQPTVSSSDRIQEGDEYVLAVTVYDQNDDNLSQVIIDQNQFSIFTDEDNLFDIVRGRVIDPDGVVDQDPDGFPVVGVDQGHSEGEFWIEDGVVLFWELFQNSREIPSNPFGEIVSLKAKLISNRNDVKDGRLDYSDPETYFVIQETDVPFEVVDNSQEIPLYRGETDRPFNLDPEDYFGKIIVNSRDIDATGGKIDVLVGLKINWQFWNKLNGVPDVFFDQTDAFNGKNQRSSNYSEKPVSNPFDVRGVLFVECKNQNNSKTTLTAVEIPLTVYDYGEDKYTRQNDFPDFSVEIFTEKLDGTDLAKSILTNEPTKIKAHFINNGRVSGSNPFWFMVRLEENEQPSFNIWELSTLRQPLTGSPIVPLDGELTLKVYSDGADGYFVECQTDPDQLSSGVTYKPSARIGSNEDGVGIGFGYSEGFTIGFDS